MRVDAALDDADEDDDDGDFTERHSSEEARAGEELVDAECGCPQPPHIRATRADTDPAEISTAFINNLRIAGGVVDHGQRQLARY